MMSQIFAEHSFKPRLLMLKRLGQHLQTLLHTLSTQHFSDITAPAPLDAAHLFVAQQHMQLRSETPLSLPAAAGRQAQLLTKPFVEALPDTHYDLPELCFDLLDPKGQTVDTRRIQPGSFTSFASGQASKQILEYLTTIINIELQDWNFQCLRQQQSLFFQALPAAAGWNLQLSEVTFSAQAQNPCHAHLEAGLSTLTSAQQAGQTAFCWWGPYRINEIRCEVCLPFQPDLETFASQFLAELQPQLEPTGLIAQWTPDKYLYLQTTQPNMNIQVVAEASPPLKAPHFHLQLKLPIAQETACTPPPSLGTLEINGVPIEIQGVSCEDGAAAGQLLEQINSRQAETGVLASLKAQHLHFQSLQPHRPLHLVTQSPTLSQALGLTEHHATVISQNELEQALSPWSTLLQRLLNDMVHIPSPSAAASEFQQQIKDIPLLLGSAQPIFQVQAGVWLRLPQPAQDYLNHAQNTLEAWLTALEQPAPAPEQVMLELLEAQPKTESLLPKVLNPLQRERPEPKGVTFDHQI